CFCGIGGVSLPLPGQLEVEGDIAIVWSQVEGLLKFVDRTVVVILLQQVNAAIVELLRRKRPLPYRWIERCGEWSLLAEENVVKALSDHVAAELRGLHGHLLL